MPQEPSLNLIAPPPNLGNSTNIRVGDQIIEITPHNVTTVKQLGQGAYGFVELIRHQPSGIELAVKVSAAHPAPLTLACSESVPRRCPTRLVCYAIWRC